MAIPPNEGKLHSLWLHLLPGEDGVKTNGSVFQLLQNAHDYGKAIWSDKKAGLPGLPERILNHEVTWYGFDGKEQPAGKRNTVTLAAVIGWLDSGIHQLLTGQAAILAAVKAISANQGTDPATLAKVIDEAVSRAADKHLADIGTYELRRVETPAADPTAEGTEK